MEFKIGNSLWKVIECSNSESPMCEDLLMACDELLILSDVSYGVQKEIDLANTCKIPIRYYKEDE